MNENQSHSDDKDLSRLLKGARPSPELLPGFQHGVWRRIEAADPAAEAVAGPSWLDRIAAWLVTPRLALAALALLIVLGSGMGVANGMSQGKQLQRDRYMVSVNPMAMAR